MAVKTAINGFGRIGKLAFKAAIEKEETALDVIAINDLTDTKTLAHLFKYDSTFGRFSGTVEAGESSIIINGKEIKVFSERDPANLPWKELGVSLVIESTGKFTDPKKAQAHIEAGAKKVIISAPAKGDVPTFVLGVNEDKYNPAKDHIISNASCTTNCLAPIAKVLLDRFGIKKGLMTTIHSYTNDQVTLDFPHRDLRRARAAALSMIPTSTGAARAIGLVIPELNGKLDGIAIRVPTPDVSLVDLCVNVERKADISEVNKAFKEAAEGRLKGYLEYCDEPLVSRDFYGSTVSSAVDALSTKVIDDMVRVYAWYDNEWGYSNRIADLAGYIIGRGI